MDGPPGPGGTKGRSPGQQPAGPASQADPGAETTCILGGAGRRLCQALRRGQTPPWPLLHKPSFAGCEGTCPVPAVAHIPGKI